jgi:hypothetical protein
VIGLPTIAWQAVGCLGLADDHRREDVVRRGRRELAERADDVRARAAG